MKVLDHEPHVWFLLEDDGTLYLDAHCSFSVFDYSVLIALDTEETLAYQAKGRPYMGDLAERIHNSAPARRHQHLPLQVARPQEGAKC